MSHTNLSNIRSPCKQTKSLCFSTKITNIKTHMVKNIKGPCSQTRCCALEVSFLGCRENTAHSFPGGCTVCSAPFWQCPHLILDFLREANSLHSYSDSRISLERTSGTDTRTVSREIKKLICKGSVRQK